MISVGLVLDEIYHDLLELVVPLVVLLWLLLAVLIFFILAFVVAIPFFYYGTARTFQMVRFSADRAAILGGGLDYGSVQSYLHEHFEAKKPAQFLSYVGFWPFHRCRARTLSIWHHHKIEDIDKWEER